MLNCNHRAKFVIINVFLYKNKLFTEWLIAKQIILQNPKPRLL